MTSPINASALLDNTAIRENLLNFVENFDTAPNRNPPSTPSPTFVEMASVNPPHSHPLLRYNLLQTVSNQARRNRQGPPRTPLQLLASFIEKCRRRRLAFRARQQQKSQGVCSILPKTFDSPDKKEIVGLPSLFEVGLLAELSDEDEFLGPMKRTILDNDVQSFSKQGVCISQFWPIASVVDNCILIYNKLVIPFKLRSAILTRLHRSHPGQLAIIEAAEYIWWHFMNRQIVKKCQECMECTKFGNNLKLSKTFNSSLPLPPFAATNYS